MQVWGRIDRYIYVLIYIRIYFLSPGASVLFGSAGGGAEAMLCLSADQDSSLRRFWWELPSFLTHRHTDTLLQ